MDSASIWTWLVDVVTKALQWLCDMTPGEFLLALFSALLVWVTLRLVHETKRTTMAADNAVVKLGDLANRIHQATLAQEKAVGAAERHAFTVQSEALRWATDSYFKVEDELKRAFAETDENRRRAAAEHYFERLWGLHQAQYALRKLGTLPEQPYATWLKLRAHHYSNGSNVAGMSQHEGLHHAKTWMLDKEFALFVDGFIGKKMSQTETSAYVADWMMRINSDKA
jgi:hypothetical protein